MNKKNIELFFQRLAELNPNPKPELKYNSPFELLVAVILSAQATDNSVNKATAELFKVAKNPEEFINLGEEKLKDYIKSIGLFNTKAKNIIKTAKIIKEKYNNKIPDNLKNLEQLAGVGRKTANVILNVIYQKPTLAVDTHIFRIANRIGLATGKTTLEVENNLLKVIPKKYLLNAHHWLILHGRYICTAKKLNCLKCPVYDLCEYENKINKYKE